MTRRNREEIARMEAVAHSINRVGMAANTTLAMYIGGGAGAGALLGYAMDDTAWRMAAGGAGIGGLLGLVLFSAAAWDLTRAAITKQATQGDGDRVGHVSGGWYLTAAEGWNWNDQRRYLCDVDAGRARFSQDGAAAWGDVEPDEFNALLHRMVDLGLYRTNNEGRYDHRNQGVWLERGKEMLQGIKDGE